MVLEHARLRIEAELAWHHKVLDRAGKLTADSETARPGRRTAP